jgi:hypothetical protein
VTFKLRARQKQSPSADIQPLRDRPRFVETARRAALVNALGIIRTIGAGAMVARK